MKKVGALGVLMILVGALMALTLPAAGTGGGYGTTTTYQNDPCDEYHESRHPECQTTTTGYETTTTDQVTTTTSEVTTTTSENTTTTEQQTTTTFVQQTTTTAAPCAAGLVHQPPLCVDPSTTTVAESPTTTASTITPPAEELPFTGFEYEWLLAIGLTALVTGGFLVRKYQV